jgi:hypothetical protein
MPELGQAATLEIIEYRRTASRLLQKKYRGLGLVWDATIAENTVLPLQLLG